MLGREDIKNYALEICMPLMERTARRYKRGDLAFKADQVGFIPAFLENLCRPFWGIAPVISENEDIKLNISGKEVSAFEYLREILVEGLTCGNEKSWSKNKKYFGDFVYANQNITELAGLMIGMYFARKQLWDPFSQNEKELIAKEIYEMSVEAFDHSWPNNHYWFPLFAVTVLKSFGFVFDRTEQMLETGLEFLDSLYIGEGWYKDGEFGRFDYYEAWSLHLYPLLWTLIADNSFEGYEQYKEKYIERTNKFLDFYTHWFDAKGANVAFGRSLSYRFAACALFPAAVLAGCDINPSLAGRITAMNIEFFKNNCKTEETDILPEGYLYQSPCVIEGYTSDGGAYWCCKAFMALLIPENHPFWDIDSVKLPSESGNYTVVPAHKDIHMIFEGNGGRVTMYNNTAQYYQNGLMTHKFGNVRNWYSKFAYNSAAGFGCSGVDNISIDSMISLMTKDKAMNSHRLGFTDLGYENGILHSVHIPFANDRETEIETYLVPLGGMHACIHKVTLSQEYYVCEAGFSLARWDDYMPTEVCNSSAKVSNYEYTSVLSAAAGVPVKFEISAPQAGFHLYAPLAAYPMYCTEDVLPEGEYVFASLHGVFEKGKEPVLPEIRLSDGGVFIGDRFIEINGKAVNKK